MIKLLPVLLISIMLCAGTLTAQPKPDETVILDDFEDTWGDKPVQTNFGAVKGYLEYGENNVPLGGGQWYTFSDAGSAVMNGEASDTISFINFEKLIEKASESSYMNVWLKTAQSSIEYPYAGVGCTFSGTGAGTIHDFSNLISIKLKVKGQGKVILRLETNDVLSQFDWGFYQYEIDLPSDWEDITIPVSSLTPAPYSEPALQGWTWDHGKKETVKFAFQTKDTVDAHLFVDNIIFEGMKYSNITPVISDHKKDFVVNPIKKHENAFHLLLNNTDYVQFTIFDLKGTCIIKLIDGNKEKGSYCLPWNGKNKNGISVTKGTYVAYLTTSLQTHWKQFTITQ